MTREERALKNLKQMCSNGRYLGSYVPLEVLEDFDLAIKALEQEPFINKPGVSSGEGMSEQMKFPETWEEYEKYYGFNDSKEVYTNNSRLIPSFRVKQWLDHLPSIQSKPMQVELEGDGYANGELVYDYGKCPKCGWEFADGGKDWEEPYCCHCGQKLHWFESEE